MKNSNNKQGFKTPDGYFDKLTDKILERTSKVGPSLPKKDGFKVPDDYFENLSAKVAQQVGHKETKVISLWANKKWYLAAASIAAIAIIVFGTQWNSAGEISFDDLANTDIETYLQHNELELTTYEIAQVLPVEELEINDILDIALDGEHIIEYLDENIDDIEDLNLEYDE
ncbi:hypothetical protein [Spongiimicrobium sp. 3-5]|uniref:hypothetical protein n=1 Tax=Spongiimicrobium sp. 3-5 TaxID=3332596 RepID=UPI00397F2FA1